MNKEKLLVILIMSLEENKKNTIPWVEKYRPSHFDDIVLDPLNKKILNEISLPQIKNYINENSKSIKITEDIINSDHIKERMRNLRLRERLVSNNRASDPHTFPAIQRILHLFLANLFT